MTVTFRPAVPSDVPWVRACAEAAYAPYVEVIGQKPAPMVADFETYVRQGHLHLAMATDSAPVGFVVFFARARDMFLENVAVLPSATGQGAGRALIGLCEAEAVNAGLNRVVLYTNAKMAANLRLYPRLGYVEVDRRHEDGFDRVYFEKALNR